MGDLLPSSPGSPPMRTHCEIEGVGPSRTKSCHHPGGLTKELGGAVTVQVVPLQENSGNIVRPPMTFPWVLEVPDGKELKGLKSVHRVSRRLTCYQRDTHIRDGAVGQLNVQGILAAIGPVSLRHGECRLRASLSQIWWNVDLDPHLFRELGRAIGVVRLGVRARDEDTAVREKGSLTKILARDETGECSTTHLRMV